MQLDRSLASRLTGFAHYGETVKSTLRNAELTFQHPELFGEQVDKSTVIVEYVKAIDLLLHERVGSRIVADSQLDLLAKMQSRVVQLQLHEESISVGQRIRDLQCGTYFDTTTFPTQKLVALGVAVLSGRLVQCPQRVIDGLRAWSMLFLVFARKFFFKNKLLTPLFQVKQASPTIIGKLAHQLNLLQTNRNDAAHRGTVLMVSDLTLVRTLALEVLDALDQTLP